MTKWIIIAVGMIVLGFPVGAQVIAVAPILPLLVVSADGKIPTSGRSFDLVKEAVRLAAVEVNFEIQPWVRAYATATQTKDVLLFPVARTLEREDLFEWLGPVNRLDYSVFQLASSTLEPPTSIDQLKNHVTGVLRDDAAHKFLKTQLPKKDLVDVAEYASLVPMLLAGRVDYIAVVPGSLQADLEKRKLAFTSVVKRFDLRYTDDPFSYAVVAKGSDPQLVQALRKSFATMQTDGTWQKIFDRY